MNEEEIKKLIKALPPKWQCAFALHSVLKCTEREPPLQLPPSSPEEFRRLTQAIDRLEILAKSSQPSIDEELFSIQEELNHRELVYRPTENVLQIWSELIQAAVTIVKLSKDAEKNTSAENTANLEARVFGLFASTLDARKECFNQNPAATALYAKECLEGAKSHLDLEGDRLVDPIDFFAKWRTERP